MSPSLLHERFPALVESLPRVGLGEGPTPVRPLACAGAGAWVKDDGRYGGLWGGNKARKLEWILADARRRGRTTIVTVGAVGTNHGLATALYAGELGMRTVLALVEQPRDEHVEAQLARIRASGAHVYMTGGTLRTVLAAPWILLRHASLRRLRLPYLLGVGGSSPVGSLGYVEAGLELAAQVRAGELPAPRAVVLAVGSGGTAAGLALGLRIAGLGTRVVGVRVNDRMPLGERVLARLARRTHRLLRRRGAELEVDPPGPGDLTVRGEWLGDGYGHGTAEAERARELAAEVDGLRLDPVYTAKAMAGLLAMRNRGDLEGPVLYWHTHNSR